MSDNDFSMNIDDILAEFSSYSTNLVAEETGQKSPAAAPEKEKESSPPEAPSFPGLSLPESPAVQETGFRFPPAAPEEKTFSFETESVKAPDPRFDFPMPPARRAVEEPTVIAPAPVQANPRSGAAPAEPTMEMPAARRRPRQQRASAPPAVSPAPTSPAPVPQRQPQRRPVRRAPEVIEGENRPMYPQSRPARPASPEFDPERLGYAQPRSPRPAAAGPRKAPERPAPPRRREPAEDNKPEKKGIFSVLGIIFAVISVFAMSWVLINVHPNSGQKSGTGLVSSTNLVEKFDNFVNNSASDALSDLIYIPKIYTIAEDVTVAPKPNPDNFGQTTDPQEVMAVIESAAALLDGQEVVFDPNASFVSGAPIKWYLDDTILAITWQEDINGKCCSCAEVKVAHGSQIRRKVAGDTYSVGVRYLASDMAKECNSVVAINGDFYDFRPNMGVTVVNRQLFRFLPDRLDSCHVTGSGDFLFSYAGELPDEEYTKQFIKDNDVIFTLSFGPVMIDNGEIREIPADYPIGEFDRTYSRSGIGQMDELHYFMMTINYGVGYQVAGTLAELQQYMLDKGCPKAYGLDGGQTSILMMNGEWVNHVDYGNERTMSDIIYFATAIPEEEAAK